MRAYSSANPPDRLRLLLRILVISGAAGILVNLTYFWWKRNQPPVPPVPSAQQDAAQSSGAPQYASGRPPVSPSVRARIQQGEQWLLLHPGDIQMHLVVARLYFTSEQFSEAIRHLSVVRSRQPRNAAVHLRLALAYKQSGQMEEALTSIRQALLLAPGDVATRQWLGEIYLEQGRSDDALRAFEQCIKQDPKSYSAWMGKARSLEQLRTANRAVATMEFIKPVEKALQLEPDNPQGLSVLARMVFTHLAQLERAEKLARRAIQIDPALAQPYLVLVEVFLNSPTPAHLDEALTLAQKAVQLDTSQPEPLYLLARAQLAKNQNREAIDSLERSLRINSMPEAVYLLSTAYARVGDVKRSRQYGASYRQWNSFMEKRKVLLAELQHTPQNLDLYCRISELYLAEGSHQPAQNWALKAQQLQKNHPRVRSLLALIEKQKQQTPQLSPLLGGRTSPGAH